MYRKFQLENSLGDKWDLTDLLFKSYFNNPSGFGFSQSIETVQYGNAQNVKTSTTEFPSVSGDILFYDYENETKYEMYERFVDFCTYSPLLFKYRKPMDNSVYTLKCEVSSLQKTEVKNDSMLTCPISFLGLGMWQGEKVEFSGSSLTYAVINGGHMPCGFEITIEGSMVNPYFTLEQDGELYGEGKFDDATAFGSVYVNSNDGEQSVELKQGGSILPNPLSYQDLSISNGSIYVTFVKLARGSSTLTVGMDSGSVTSINVNFVPKYRSV